MGGLPRPQSRIARRYQVLFTYCFCKTRGCGASRARHQGTRKQEKNKTELSRKLRFLNENRGPDLKQTVKNRGKKYI
jgi:hypothetical protein